MKKSDPASRLRSLSLGIAAIAAGLALSPDISRADESGISFWLPGQYASLVAAPATPGWAVAAVYYHTSVDASGAAAASREFQVGRFSPTININLNLSLSGQADLIFVAPSYTFAQPVFGGQLAVTLASVYGRNSASIAGTLTGPLGNTFSGFQQDALVSVGDLYPTVSLKWNKGVHNFMVYGSGDIPVGDYNPSRLANLGIGHGAIDAGAGYTYFNPATGNELSGIGGFTYNFLNPDTNYQSGIDFHFDWACRTSCRSSCSSVSSAMPISRSPTISGSRRCSAASARACSASVRRSATSSRSPTSRPSSVSAAMANSPLRTGRRAGTPS